MDRYTETADATTPSNVEEECEPCILLQSPSDRYRATVDKLQDAASSVVVARFSMHEMAHEALDEARLWFSEEDLVCIPGSDDDARVSPAQILHEQRYSLLTRVSDLEEALRAVDIMLGRGATRVDVLPTDCALQRWLRERLPAVTRQPEATR